MKQNKKKRKSKESQVTVVTVYNHYRGMHGAHLHGALELSPNFFCVVVLAGGKEKHELYFPIECCLLASPALTVLSKIQNKVKKILYVVASFFR